MGEYDIVRIQIGTLRPREENKSRLPLSIPMLFPLLCCQQSNTLPSPRLPFFTLFHWFSANIFIPEIPPWAPAGASASHTLKPSIAAIEAYKVKLRHLGLVFKTHHSFAKVFLPLPFYIYNKLKSNFLPLYQNNSYPCWLWALVLSLSLFTSYLEFLPPSLCLINAN